MKKKDLLGNPRMIILLVFLPVIALVFHQQAIRVEMDRPKVVRRISVDKDHRSESMIYPPMVVRKIALHPIHYQSMMGTIMGRLKIQQRKVHPNHLGKLKHPTMLQKRKLLMLSHRDLGPSILPYHGQTFGVLQTMNFRKSSAEKSLLPRETANGKVRFIQTSRQ